MNTPREARRAEGCAICTQSRAEMFWLSRFSRWVCGSCARSIARLALEPPGPLAARVWRSRANPDEPDADEKGRNIDAAFERSATPEAIAEMCIEMGYHGKGIALAAQVILGEGYAEQAIAGALAALLSEGASPITALESLRRKI
jgi:hypothetical protein